MPYGLQVRTNRGIIDVGDVFGLQLIDTRTRYLGATDDNQGSFTIPLRDYTSFNNVTFRVFCVAGRDVYVSPGARPNQNLATHVTFPSTIGANSVATVNYRGGIKGNFLFNTWICEI